MQKILVIAFIGIIGLTIISGCKKKSSSSPYFVKANIGSTTIDKSNCYAVITGNFLEIHAQDMTSATTTYPDLYIFIADWHENPGTTVLDSVTNWSSSRISYALNDSLVSTSNTGSVVITSVSATAISGTFSCTCNNGTSISNGRFTVQRD